MDVIQLTDRGTVSIAGADAASLLQGLITCSVPAVERDGIASGALLSPQGKLLFDFILHADGEGF
ncbi:MAG: folate-binding protein, partial [Pseudomonadota bacterium]